MNAKRIWIHRHAESLSNAGEKTLDLALIPLSEKGRAQAEALAASIVETPDQIIVSPFLRTTQTAAPISARFVHAPVDVWQIQEFTYLEPTSCIGTSWVERKPRIDAYWAKLDPDYVDGEGAESFGDLLTRARAFLSRLTTVTEALTLVVSHGQFMQASLLLAEHPALTPLEAMTLFRARQEVSAFVNCERLALHIENERILIDGRAAISETA